MKTTCECCGAAISVEDLPAAYYGRYGNEVYVRLMKCPTLCMVCRDNLDDQETELKKREKKNGTEMRRKRMWSGGG